MADTKLNLPEGAPPLQPGHTVTLGGPKWFPFHVKYKVVTVIRGHLSVRYTLVLDNYNGSVRASLLWRLGHEMQLVVGGASLPTEVVMHGF